MSIAARINDYRDSSSAGHNDFFGPREIHQMVKDGVITYAEAEKYFTRNQTALNNQHREGGKGRGADGMNLYDVFASGANSSVGNFDTDRYYGVRTDIQDLYNTNAAAGLSNDEQGRIDAMNKFYGTDYKDVGDFSQDQFGYWHTQANADAYEANGKGGDYWMKQDDTDSSTNSTTTTTSTTSGSGNDKRELDWDAYMANYGDLSAYYDDTDDEGLFGGGATGAWFDNTGREMGADWEQGWVDNLNKYYNTDHDDVNDFTSAQFGEVHYDLYGAKEGRDLFYKNNDDDDNGDSPGGDNNENTSVVSINNSITQDNYQEANAYNEFGDITNVGNDNTVSGNGSITINNQQTAGNNTATNNNYQFAAIDNDVETNQAAGTSSFADDIFRRYGVRVSF